MKLIEGPLSLNQKGVIHLGKAEGAKGLTKIGVFYDGEYFYKVSSYYAYQHEKKSRISIGGLHDFIRNQIAIEVGVDPRLCQIVDAHYFRGRMSAKAATSNLIYNERVFDEILMYEGVITHYLPLKNYGGRKQEKGIDVWLALEAYELASYKHFDVIALIASDGDYVPLIRKLKTLGTKVMLLSWDFKYLDDNGELQETRTSHDLLEEVSYPIAMHQVIEDRVRRKEPIVKNLFVPKSNPVPNGELEVKTSKIHSVKDGFGFINYKPNNIFFHYSSVINVDFSDLKTGDNVAFKIENRNGKLCAIDVKKI